ncbi:MAG: outer membrane beta-barrel protein [Tannerella sp.]|jgi:hypothetical protein|nr:outer membrane beta-barrel protein [Tannerella sp.]
MAHSLKITIAFIFLLFAVTGGYAQQSCYQIGLNEGRALFDEAQRLSRSGRCVDAAPKYWEALSRFRLTRSCRDLPANHELRSWEDRCINGITSCGAKYDETTVLATSSRLLRFAATAGAEQTITVNSNSDAWSVESLQSWCTARKNGNRLIVSCRENTSSAGRTARIVVTSNALTVEVTIEQAGKTQTQTPVETPVADKFEVTSVKLAGGYPDGASGQFGEELFNDMTSLRAQLTGNYTVKESKPISLDIKILDPSGKLVSDAGSGYTFSQSITLQSGAHQDAPIELTAWKPSVTTAFDVAGKYAIEIWNAGVKQFDTTFDIAERQVPLSESIRITGVQFAGRYADNSTTSFGDSLYNNIQFVTPRITSVNVTGGNKIIPLDFRLLDPDGNVLIPTSALSRHKEVRISGNIRQTYIFDAPEWGYASGTPFGKPGVYKFEVSCEGVRLYDTSFEVLPKRVVRAAAVKVAGMKTIFGVKAGLNLSSITNNTSNLNFSPSMSPNFHAGIFVELNLNPKDDKPGLLGVQPEILYSRQGFAVDGDAVSFDYAVGLLMLKLHVHKNVNVELGPWFSYLLSVSPENATIGGQSIQLSDLKGGKDVGAAVGIGYDFDMGLMVGARYLYGLSDMANNLSWTNQVIAISLGWKF